MPHKHYWERAHALHKPRFLGDPDWTELCPYCRTKCECDLVDNGVGLVQVGPYYCDNCRASQIGPCDENEAFACEKIFGWYGPERPPGSSANVINGKVVSHREMLAAYRQKFMGNPLWEDKSYVDNWYKNIRERK
jgi:hypothetical protein